MSTWTSVPLGTILRLRNEIVHPRDKPSGEAIFVGLEHIESDTGRRTGEVRIQLELLAGRKARFHPGDIVYGYLRPYLNKVWLADRVGYCSVDQYVFAVSHDVDPQYVAHFMRSPAYLEAAPIDATPGQLPRIRTAEVLSVPIALPPIAEQRRIAVRLSDQLAHSGRARQAAIKRRSAVADLRESIVTSAFAASEEVRVPARELGTLQDGDWILNADYSMDGVRLFQVGDVGRGDLRPKSNRFISLERASELKCTMLNPGDILISRMPDPIGRACLVPDLGYLAITAVDVTIFRPNEKVLDREFALLFMNSQKWLQMAAAKASGATRARISRTNLELLEIPVPALSAQRRLASILRERLAAVEAIATSVGAEVDAVDSLFRALLRRAFDHESAA